MANIATLLARILSTRYGNEMRQDLHDAIEAVNDDTETALGKKLTFTTNTRKLKLLAKDDTVLSEVVIPGGGSGGGSVDSVNGLFPDENGNVELNLDDINDVDITSAEDGDALVYDATSHKWVNGAGGGGTSDYNHLSNKPSINGVTLSGNKTSADLGISGGGSNENLVPNGWFNINTKNTATFNALFDGTSKIDGWGTNVNSGGQAWTWASDMNTIFLNCTLGTGFGQIVHEFDKNPLISGKEFTLSVLYADGTIKTKTATYQNSSSGEWTTDTYSGSFAGVYSVPSSNNYLSVYFRCNEGYSALIKAIKLEIGGSSTLIVDTFPNPNLEKVRCNGVMRSNRNLLDNPWFTVNQRGFTSIVSANNNDTTLFDRWKNANGGDTQSSTISLGSSGLTLTQNTTTTNPWQICLDQIMEENVISNKVITFSVLLADGTLIKSSGLFNADIINEYDISTNLKLVYGMWTYNGKVRARIGIRTPQSYSQSASVTIRAVKLELGTESTLALDTAPNYTEELLKCQRYYYPLSGKEFMGFKSSNYEVKVPLPTEMRTTPTISLTGTSIGLTGSSQQGGSISSATVTVSGNEALVNVGLTMAGGGSDYNVCSAFEIFNLVGYLSAEL